MRATGLRSAEVTSFPDGMKRPHLPGRFVNGWQLNGILNVSSGTPFTVYDSANVSLQGSAPEIFRLLFQPSGSDS